MSNRLAPDVVPRRDFLGLAGLWATGIAVVGSVLGMLRLPMPRVLPEASSRFRIGMADEFTTGSEQVIGDRNVLILARDDGVAAVSLICTHLGCVVIRADKNDVRLKRFEVKPMGRARHDAVLPESRRRHAGLPSASTPRKSEPCIGCWQH